MRWLAFARSSSAEARPNTNPTTGVRWVLPVAGGMCRAARLGEPTSTASSRGPIWRYLRNRAFGSDVLDPIEMKLIFIDEVERPHRAEDFFEIGAFVMISSFYRA